MDRAIPATTSATTATVTRPARASHGRRVVGSVVADCHQSQSKHAGPRRAVLPDSRPASVRRHAAVKARPDDGTHLGGATRLRDRQQSRAGDHSQSRPGVEQMCQRRGPGSSDSAQPRSPSCRCRKSSTKRCASSLPAGFCHLELRYWRWLTKNSCFCIQGAVASNKTSSPYLPGWADRVCNRE